jgi:hypothetical protein
MSLDFTVYVASLRAEDWPRWLQICPDLPATHKEWLDNPDPIIKGADITDIREVVVLPDRFLAWSKTSGAPLDRIGRTQYAIMLGTAATSRAERCG